MTRSLLPLTAILSIMLFSCSGDRRSAADQRFEALTARYMETVLTLHPEKATALGDHRFDDRMNDYSRERVAADIALCEAYLDTLNTIKVEELSADHMIDYDILRQSLRSEVFTLKDLREWEWNPLVYNPGEALYVLIARESSPLSTRMQALASRLHGLPAVLNAARTNLLRPPAIHTETAILQNEGVISMLKEVLQPSIDKLDNPLRSELIAARDSAVVALSSYGTWLRDELLARSDRDFRIGEELYTQKFMLRLDTEMTPEQLLTRARQDLERTQDEMYATALPLFAAMFPRRDAAALDHDQLIREVLLKLSDNRPDDATIVDRAKRDLADASEFVRSNDFVTIPSEPLDVIVMPEFQRGVAVAYCDSPGPLEKNGKTFFAIAPTPETWVPMKRESFYREYNDYMLKNLVIHEAMPGHFLQLAVANKTKAPTMLRGIMPSGVFAEGWATYSEQIMANAGFGGPEVKMQQLKMRLRLLINAILDQGLHRTGMSEKEGLALMMEEGYQERGEAEGKWRRACLTSAQLSTYYYGNIMINDIRTRYEAKAGASFSLKKFHDALLSYGSISPKYFPVLFKLSTPAASVASR